MLFVLKQMRFKSKLPTKLHFVPGCSGYLKFPQYERSITTTCRDIIEISLIDCFYAKDFDGAFQVLIMNDIRSVYVLSVYVL